MWKNIEINIQNIETDIGKATLIKMPNKSRYAGYKFWHLSKLVRNGSNSYARTITYNEDWEFKLFKNGNGKHNKFEVVDEIKIGIEEAFECMSDCTRSKSEETYLIVKEPKKVDKEVKIEEKLKNDRD